MTWIPFYILAERYFKGILSRKEAKKTKARGKLCQRNKTPFSPAISAFGGEYGETKRLLAGWHCRQ